jgi:hypothetical protein
MLLTEAQRVSLTLKDPKHLGRFTPGWTLWPDVEQMARDRLADVQAKRRVLARCAQIIEANDVTGYPEPERFKWDPDAQFFALAIDTIRDLAQPYAGREGWQEAWRA